MPSETPADELKRKAIELAQAMLGITSPTDPPKPGATATGNREQGWALFQAAEQGRAHGVRALLAAGADPNYVDSGHGTLRDRCTPLMMAAAMDRQGSHAEVIRLLAAAGADLDYQDPEDMRLTALMHAAMSNNVGAVQQLLAYGARRDIKNRDGITALEYTKNKEVISLFSTTAVTGRPSADILQPGQSATEARASTAPANDQNRMAAELTKSLLGVIAEPAGQRHFVVHAANAEEKWFLMFEGFRLALGGIADNRKLQLLCVSPDETARAEARIAYRQMMCLLPLEFETISRFSGIDDNGFTVGARVSDIHATNAHGYPLPLDPEVFIILADIDYSAKRANELFSKASENADDGDPYSGKRSEALVQLAVKRTESGLRNVLKSKTISVLFHVEGKRPIFELPPGKVEPANIKGGCLALVLLLSVSIGSAVAGLRWLIGG